MMLNIQDTKLAELSRLCKWRFGLY